jgi:hypothetical protein
VIDNDGTLADLEARCRVVFDVLAARAAITPSP